MKFGNCHLLYLKFAIFCSQSVTIFVVVLFLSSKYRKYVLFIPKSVENLERNSKSVK